MVNCNSCGNEALDYIQCSQCQNVYDYGDCSGITEAGYQGLGPDRQAVWKCPTCKQGKVKKPKKTKDNPGNVSPNAISLDRVMEELNKIKLSLAPLLNVMDGIREIKDEISDVKSSMKIYSDKLDSLEGRLISVEKACDAAGKLEDRISALEADLNEKNQWARLNNVEIKGVPLKDRENLLEIVSRIGTKISYPISKQNINFVARVPSQDNKLKPIIVSFVNRYVKEDFVAAARRFKKLLPTDIGLDGAGQVFINDHLTVQNKMLLTEAKKLKNKHEFEFLWVKNSKIFARKNPQSKVILIKTSKDLIKIC
ncbi:hypothetical protein NE865_12680 [Phthorimaea operculella]|nr:hypothetical protein NE865_12680 [Phthorimaea operculella]